MTDKRILIECDFNESTFEAMQKRFDDNVKVIFYSKDFLKITEIDLDEGTVKDIPRTENGKVILTARKDSPHFEYKIVEDNINDFVVKWRPKDEKENKA